MSDLSRTKPSAFCRVPEYTDGLFSHATRLDASWNRWMFTRSKALREKTHIYIISCVRQCNRGHGFDSQSMHELITWWIKESATCMNVKQIQQSTCEVCQVKETLLKSLHNTFYEATSVIYYECIHAALHAADLLHNKSHDQCRFHVSVLCNCAQEEKQWTEQPFKLISVNPKCFHQPNPFHLKLFILFCFNILWKKYFDWFYFKFNLIIYLFKLYIHTF